MLAQLASQLRKARGLTQDQLAQRAQIDPETISRVEQNRGPSWRGSTARKIFEALWAILPVSEDESREFLSLTNLDPGVYQYTKSMYSLNQSPRPGQPDRFTAAALPMLTELAKAVGPEIALAMLRGCWIAAATIQSFPAKAASVEPRTLKVTKPSRFNSELGAFEEVIEEFDTDSDQKGA